MKPLKMSKFHAACYINIFRGVKPTTNLNFQSKITNFQL